MEVGQVCIAFTHRVSMYNILFFKDCRPGDVCLPGYAPCQKSSVSPSWMEQSISHILMFLKRAQLSSGEETAIGGGGEEG